MNAPTTGYTKRALVRDPNAPDGVTADLFIRCGCGRLLPTADPPCIGIACPDCATVYDPRGWIIGNTRE